MRIDEAHSTGKDHVPVPTQEDRIAALERKVAMLELLRSHQGGDIKAIKEDASSIKDRLGRLETQSTEQTTLLNEHTGRFDHVEALLTHILARLPEKP
jgi:uncharacterized coiled-coil protein SlyX